MPSNQLEKLYIDVDGRLDGLKQSFRDAEALADKSAKSVQDKFSKAVSGLNNFGNRLSTTVTPAILAAGTAIFGVAAGTGELAEKLNNLSQSTGLSKRRLQELKYIADTSGISFEGIANGVVALQRRLYGLEKDGGSVADVLKRLGIEAKDANGNFLSMDVLFPQIIGKLQNMSNVTERNVLASQLFGRGYAELAPILGLTSKEMGRAAKEAHRLGLVLGDDALKKAQEFDDTIDRLKSTFAGSFRQIALAAIPILQALVRFLTPIVESLGKLSQRTLTWVVGIGALVAALGPLAKISAVILGTWQKLQAIRLTSKLGNIIVAGAGAGAAASGGGGGITASQMAAYTGAEIAGDVVFRHRQHQRLERNIHSYIQKSPAGDIQNIQYGDDWADMLRTLFHNNPGMAGNLGFNVSQAASQVGESLGSKIIAALDRALAKLSPRPAFQQIGNAGSAMYGAVAGGSAISSITRFFARGGGFMTALATFGAILGKAALVVGEFLGVLLACVAAATALQAVFMKLTTGKWSTTIGEFFGMRGAQKEAKESGERLERAIKAVDATGAPTFASVAMDIYGKDIVRGGKDQQLSVDESAEVGIEAERRRKLWRKYGSPNRAKMIARGWNWDSGFGYLDEKEAQKDAEDEAKAEEKRLKAEEAARRAKEWKRKAQVSHYTDPIKIIEAERNDLLNEAMSKSERVAIMDYYSVQIKNKKKELEEEKLRVKNAEVNAEKRLNAELFVAQKNYYQAELTEAEAAYDEEKQQLEELARKGEDVRQRMGLAHQQYVNKVAEINERETQRQQQLLRNEERAAEQALAIRLGYKNEFSGQRAQVESDFKDEMLELDQREKNGEKVDRQRELLREQKGARLEEIRKAEDEDNRRKNDERTRYLTDAQIRVADIGKGVKFSEMLRAEAEAADQIREIKRSSLSDDEKRLAIQAAELDLSFRKQEIEKGDRSRLADKVRFTSADALWKSATEAGYRTAFANPIQSKDKLAQDSVKLLEQINTNLVKLNQIEAGTSAKITNLGTYQ